MNFDPTITWGAILNAVVILVGFSAAFTRIGGRIDILAMRTKAIEEAIKEQGNNYTRISILEERVTNHGTTISVVQKDVADLRRGAGYITGRRQTIDGEYS